MEKLINFWYSIKPKLLHVWDFCIRHGTTILLGAFALYLLGYESALIKTCLQIVVVVSLVILMSGFTLFAYTKVKFTKAVLYGADGEANSVEQHSIMQLLGFIFIGIAIIASVMTLGVYFVNMDMSSIPALNGLLK